MTKVFIVAGLVPPRPAVLADGLRQLRDRGAQVHMACHFALDRLQLDQDLAELRRMSTAPTGVGSALRAVRGGDPARQVWLRTRRDPWVRKHARTADVLVALDQRAVHTVWQLAQRHRRCDAVFGLNPAIKAVDARISNQPKSGWRTLRGPSPRLLASETRHLIRDTPRVLARAATGRRAMRLGVARAFWRTALSAPGVPDRARAVLANRVRESMIRAGRTTSAAAMTASAARRLRDLRMRADLLGPIVDLELAEGRMPAHLSDAVAGELSRAETLYRSTSPTKAAPAVARALDLLFHRVLHIDSLTSPLAEDPEKFLAPLHESQIGEVLAGGQGRLERAVPPPAGRPPRLLFLTGLNDTFLTTILRHYESKAGVEVRCLNIAPGSAVRELLYNGRARVIFHRLSGKSQYAQTAAELFGPDLAWADVVFVDWCNVAAGMLSLVDPGTTRVVVRLHSFEAFTWWQHLVDFTRVDDLVFVSEHQRQLTIAAVPGLRTPSGPRTHVLANGMDLRRYVAPKAPQARFTVGVVGITMMAKDPRWAFEVLRELRKRDSRYRMLLVGKDIDPNSSAAAKQYRERYDRDLAELEPTGAVRRLGQTHDVSGALAQVGVILSSSVREGSPCAVVEGVASGAVPVVRNWPFFAGKPHSARTLYPDEWVVDTPKQAVERILAVTETEEIWEKERQAAADYTLARFDWTVVQHEYDRLLLGPVEPSS